MSADTASTTATGVRPFGWRDKVGYLFGDWGNDFVFILASSYLLVFYTNVAGLNPAHVGTIFLLARLLDAFTDVGWGRFLDRSKPGRLGRFRPWIIRAAFPLVVVSALLYAPFIGDWAYGAKLGYAVVTYLLWGSVFYTMVNISYGSLAAVITPDSVQRSSLSVFRGVGANLAGLFVALVPPLIIYTTVDGVSQVLPGAFFAVGIGFAAFSLLFYVLCFSLVRERVVAPPQAQRRGFFTLLRSLVGNRALIALMVGNLTLMLASLLSQSMAPYLWLSYFNNGALSGPAQLAMTLPALVLAPFAAKLVKRFGKREVIGTGLLASGVIYLGLAIVGVTNPGVFIGFSLAAGIGVGAYNLLVWALVGDVIDYEEVRGDERDDGTVYAINTWARKLGLALAGGLGGYALGFVGFQAGATVQSDETIRGIYLISTAVPGVLYVVVAAILWFWYPLSKRVVNENTSELDLRRLQRKAR